MTIRSGPDARGPIAMSWLVAAWAAVAILCLSSCSPPGPGARGAAGAAWPRFPADPVLRGERALAVLYSTDNIGPRTTLAQLGYPGRNIFRLHEDHPELHVVLMSCPASRYSGEGTVLDAKDGAATWRALALEERFTWLELGNQGYTHSPPDDTNLNHHEFSLTQDGCNVDHALLDEAAYVSGRFDLIRTAYRSLGIPDERMVLIRFPGLTAGPRALAAAADAGFVASLGTTPLADAPAGGPIEIPDTRILHLFARSKALEEGLTSGRLTRETLAESTEMQGSVAWGMAVVEKAARGTGILNMVDVWSETFAHIGGAQPRYLILDAVLDELETKYRGRVWFPRGRDLALWLSLVRDARVTTTRSGDGVEVAIVPSDAWVRAAGEGLTEASLLVDVPEPIRGAASVRIKPDGDAAWRDLEPSHHWPEPRGLSVVFPIKGPLQLQIVAD